MEGTGSSKSREGRRLSSGSKNKNVDSQNGAEGINNHQEYLVMSCSCESFFIQQAILPEITI